MQKGVGEMSGELSKYYEKTFSTAGKNGRIYSPRMVLERAHNDRKNDFPSKLPLSDLSAATVVDYGVESSGTTVLFLRTVFSCAQEGS